MSEKTGPPKSRSFLHSMSQKMAHNYVVPIANF